MPNANTKAGQGEDKETVTDSQMTPNRFMKITNLCTKMVLALALACSTLTLQADQPPDKPPRGRAFGYFLKDGGQVLFLYMDADGSRLIELLNCHQNREYAIEATEGLVNWARLTVLTIGPDGTASFQDTEPLPYRFYRVIPLK